MREREAISENPSPYEIARHIDALHTCVDTTSEKVDQALDKYEKMAITQQEDRHKARNRDMALLGGLAILLRERGYDMEFDEDSGVARMNVPPPKSGWEKAAAPATVIGTALAALASYKGLVLLAAAVHRILLTAH